MKISRWSNNSKWWIPGGREWILGGNSDKRWTRFFVVLGPICTDWERRWTALKESYEVPTMTIRAECWTSTTFFGCFFESKVLMLELPKWCINCPNENHLIDLHLRTYLLTDWRVRKAYKHFRQNEAVSVVKNFIENFTEKFTVKTFIGMKSALNANTSVCLQRLKCSHRTRPDERPALQANGSRHY